MKKWVAGVMAMTGIAAMAGPVYRCTVNGKTAYSDAPCIGGKEVDVTPTEGLNKWTGTEQKAPELITRQMSKTTRDAIAKGVGMSPKDLERDSKRFNLPDKDKAECKTLDAQLKKLKAAEPVDENALYQARARFFKLKC